MKLYSYRFVEHGRGCFHCRQLLYCSHWMVFHPGCPTGPCGVDIVVVPQQQSLPLDWLLIKNTAEDPLQYEVRLSRFRNSDDEVKTVGKSSYLYDGNFYTGQTATLSWKVPLQSQTVLIWTPVQNKTGLGWQVCWQICNISSDVSKVISLYYIKHGM